MEKKEVDFNSQEFAKTIKQKGSTKSTKNIDVTGFNFEKAKGLLKNNIIQIAIFLIAFLTVTGLISSIIFIFTYPLYFLGWLAIGIILFVLLKKKISKIKL